MKICKSKNNISENAPATPTAAMHQCCLPQPLTAARYAPFSFPCAILCSYQASKAFLVLLGSTVTSPSKLATCLTHQNHLKTLYSRYFWHFTCQGYQYSRESITAPASPVESPSVNTAATTTCENGRPKHYPKRLQATLWEHRVAAFFLAFPLLLQEVR